MREKQNPDSLAFHSGNQFPLHGFLGHQTDGPAGAAFGRIATYHGNNPLLLAVIEHGGRARTLLFKKRGLQTALLIAMADVADGLRSERDDLGNLRRAGTFGQLLQR